MTLCFQNYQLVSNGSGNISNDGKWLFDLADQIVRAGGGNLQKDVLIYSKSTGGWISRGGTLLTGQQYRQHSAFVR